jgi:hypothetical protein
VHAIKRIAPLLALGSLLMASPADADRTIDTVPRATPVSAFGGYLAWSNYQPGRGYPLAIIKTDEPTSPDQEYGWPVDPRPVPFDAELGANPHGGTVVVYSRCRQEPRLRPGYVGNALTRLPEWQTGRGCDLFELDLGNGDETRLSGASSRHASEFLPSVWKNRIVFARVYEKRKGLAGKRTYLYERPLNGKGHSRRLPAGARSTARFCSGKPVRCRRVIEPGPTALDLVGKRLAFGWDSADDIGPTSSAYLDTLGARPTRKRIVTVSSGDIQGIEVIGPTLSGGYLWWGESWFGDRTENELRRFAVGTGATGTATFAGGSPFGSVLASTVDASQVFYVRSGAESNPGCSQAAPCELRAAPLPAFNG